MATLVQGYNPTTGVNALTAEQAEFYQDELLERLIPELQWTKFGEKNKNIPKRKGATTSFRRLNSLAVNTTALTEGVTPDGVNLDIVKITAVIQEYGAWTKISDFIDMTGLDPLLQEASGLMGKTRVNRLIPSFVMLSQQVQTCSMQTARHLAPTFCQRTRSLHWTS